MRFWDARRWADENVQALVAEPVVLVNDAVREPVQGRGPARQPRFGTLTKREREILKMLAEGKSVKEIAGTFELSVKTVEAHKFNLIRKLDIHNKAQLVQYAIQKKVIRLQEPVFG